jgi:hypothetical protein
MCEFKGVRFPAKAWSKAPGGHAAKSVSGDEACSVAATRDRRPQLARQPVDVKHDAGVWLAKQPFVETPNGARPDYPNRQAGTASPLAPLLA